jgi:hypothetical protein
VFDELESARVISWWSRWRSHRAIERHFGHVARLQVSALSDFAFSYYAAYIKAGMGHEEALRLAPLSASLGDDVTNHPEIAWPDKASG